MYGQLDEPQPASNTETCCYDTEHQYTRQAVGPTSLEAAVSLILWPTTAHPRQRVILTSQASACSSCALSSIATDRTQLVSRIASFLALNKLVLSMSALRCSPLMLLLVLLSLLLSLAVAERDGFSHSTLPRSRCLSVRSELSAGHNLHGHEDCVVSFARPSSSSSRVSDFARVDAAPYPPSVTPDAAWMPEQAIAVYVQGGYWYVAIGMDASHTLLKVDAATHLPVSNVTLNSAYEIVTMVGNGTHLFVQVYTDSIADMAVMTFDTHTLEQVNNVTLRGAVLLSGVNAAGTMFIVAAVSTNSATLVNATTGLAIAALNGGNDDMFLDAATLDPTTDTVIAADQTHASIYGISFNNSLLWTIALPADQLAVESLAVDQQGRSLYAYLVVSSDDVDFPTIRLVQYSLSTHSEVASFNITDNSIDPQPTFSAGPANGEIYVANAMYGTVERITMKSGATQSTSLSRYPFLARLTGLASLNGSSIAAFTVAPFVLYDISSEGRVLRRTQVASVHVCGDTLGSPFNIDVDMHGNIYIPLCSLGVHVYSPEHKLLHVIHTPITTSPVGVAATWSGEYVYVIYVAEADTGLPVTQLWEVATSRFVANFTVDPHANSSPNAIALDISDDSLWVLDGTSWYHFAPHNNATIVASYMVNLESFNLAVDSQHRRLVLSVDSDQNQDRLEWYNMADASLVQQFQYPAPTHFGAGAVAVTKDGAVTIAAERLSGTFYFFHNNDAASPSNPAQQVEQQRAAGAEVAME